jgi:hypothetical protein
MARRSPTEGRWDPEVVSVELIVEWAGHNGLASAWSRLGRELSRSKVERIHGATTPDCVYGEVRNALGDC